MNYEMSISFDWSFEENKLHYLSRFSLPSKEYTHEKKENINLSDLKKFEFNEIYQHQVIYWLI